MALDIPEPVTPYVRKRSPRIYANTNNAHGFLRPQKCYKKMFNGLVDQVTVSMRDRFKCETSTKMIMMEID